MSAVGWLPAPAEELFGTEATAEESYEVLTVDVPPASWTEALRTARDRLHCTYFDWLSAVDEPDTGFRVTAHVVALSPVRRLLLRTTVPHSAPTLASAVGVYAGAAWHERETHEMFGVSFDGHPGLDHLLLPENFEGHPLRKDFVLAARVAKAWPGAKEPGESEHGGPKRRQMLPPGVPDPNEWGPLKGQLPPAPARPARGAGRPAAAGDRPVRRTRTAGEGSAGQTTRAAAGAGTDAAAGAEAPATRAAGPRRARSASAGSASQRAAAGETAGTAEAAKAAEAAEAVGTAEAATAARQEGEPTTPAPTEAPTAPAGPRRARSATEGSASQRATAPGTRRARSASEGSASQRAEAPAPETPAPETPAARPGTAPRSPDAPWHHARPAFDEEAPAEGGTENADSADATDDPGEKPAPENPEPPRTPEDPSGGPR
ncbi:NAD(P)H-quinone oxidoreductase subunit J, chloroplastic [Streptomyces sp. enrichment culture]|uniref:NADH-quinone oxidoreductase subunit C n=1 Tax=Streptomyces sp. enrichment culture TaxID=1795815 RepID=UPI003F5787E5